MVRPFPVRQRVLAPLALFLLSALVLGASTPRASAAPTALAAELLRDINTGAGRSFVQVAETASVGDRFFFTLYDGFFTGPLYVTDGTPGHARQLTEERVDDLVAGPDAVYYITDGVLWTSDGTAAGTRLIMSVLNGGSLTVAPDGTLFFEALHPSTYHVMLWKSDGTAAGTVPLMDFGPEFPNILGSVDNLTMVANRLFFLARNNGSPLRLWTSDGTAAGTVALSPALTPMAYEITMSAADNRLFMHWRQYDSVSGTYATEVWASDGMAAGTGRVTILDAALYQQSSATLGDELFFGTSSGLWKSDGTAAGTVLVSSVQTGGPMVRLGDVLFFSSGGALWRSDGTTAGTAPLKDAVAPLSSAPFAVAGTTLYIAATDGLWKSDGTAAGTTRVKALQMGGSGVLPSLTGAPNGAAFFVASDAERGLELWTSDSTSAGTMPIFHTGGANRGTEIGETVAIGRTVFFAASGDTGEELWTSDGTTGGTVLVKSFGEHYPHLGNMTVFNSALYFGVSGNPSPENGLWRSDGTEAGTVQLANVRVGQFVPLNGMLYFEGYSEAAGLELWKSDGTAAGTSLVRDILPGASDSLRSPLEVAGDTLIFSADDGSGVKLWTSDGTTGGTVPIADVQMGLEGATVGGRLLFDARDQATGLWELWRTDGTTTGTTRITQIGSSPAEFTAVGDRLFFRAEDEQHGIELWTSDGTAAGTTVIDIWSGAEGSNPGDLMSFQGELWFNARDATGGRELWRSDGTAGGTTRVADILPGASSSHPYLMTTVGDALLFTAWTPAAGRELWRSDGTAGGTAMALDVAPGASSDPQNLTVVGEQLFFSAFTLEYDVEPMTARLADVLTTSIRALGPEGGTVQSGDGAVQASFPAGALSVGTTVTITVQEAPSQALPGGQKAARSFTIAAEADGTPITSFTQPLTIVVRYTDAELAAAGVTERMLNLWYWNGTAWTPILPCAGCSIDTAANTITVRLDHLTEFALLGTDSLPIYLPLVRR